MRTIEKLTPMTNAAFREGDKVLVTVGSERRVGTVIYIEKMGYGVKFGNGRSEICWPDEVTAA